MRYLSPHLPPYLLPFVLFMFVPPLSAADLRRVDFERSAKPASYKELDLGKVTARIVPGGPDGSGHCLALETPSPASSCPLKLRGPIKVVKNLVLAFDYRAVIEPGYEGAYLGMGWYVDGKQWFWSSDQFSDTWRHAEVAIAGLKGSGGQVVRPGLVFSDIQLYGRVKEKTKVREATKARMKVWFDNIRLYTGERPSQLTDQVRESYSNPPMFTWPQGDGKGPQRFQCSRDAGFPADRSITIDVSTNFYTPPKPIDPGTWYWRVWNKNELAEGWSDIARMVVLPEAHRFTTRAVLVDELASLARPRLAPLAHVSQKGLGIASASGLLPDNAQLTKLAKKFYEQGVPEHPGPWVESDSRWPTWIEWYGKVAGKITGGTGMRLQRLAACAMLTGQPQVIDWAKELALKACQWDPEGGSAMRLGDIGAHHLLRGLSWCYDVCHDRLSPAERDTMRKIIVLRALQFHDRLNPFRGSEANNHSWLQTLALGEAGIVLAGDAPEAASWAEYARQLYLGRFLCCLGYQGENNEGIGYWNYGLGFVIDYADLMKAVLGIDLYKHPWLSQTARFPMYCAPPNAWAVSFADTGLPNHGVLGPAETMRVRDLAVRTRDPYALWYSGERTPVDGLAPKAPTGLPPSVLYRHIGVAIFNTSLVDGREGATVAMHSGKFFAGHQHPDQNSFVIHAYGEKLAIDGGYYDWYGSPHFKAYSMNTLAHNTLLVDGQGQAACTKGADGRITAWYDSPEYGYTVGDAADPDIYGGRLPQFDRRLLFIKPGFVVVHDLVAASQGPAQYDWLLHAVKPIEVNAATSSFSVPCERAALRGRFLSPAGLNLTVKTGFPAEPVNKYSVDAVPKENYFPEWILHAAPAKAESTEFLCAMQIQRLAPAADAAAQIEPLAAENGMAIRIRQGDHTHLVVFRHRSASGPLRCEGLETDGDAAAVELAEGERVVRAFASHATYLRCGATELFKSMEPRDWSQAAR